MIPFRYASTRISTGSSRASYGSPFTWMNQIIGLAWIISARRNWTVHRSNRKLTCPSAYSTPPAHVAAWPSCNGDGRLRASLATTYRASPAYSSSSRSVHTLSGGMTVSGSSRLPDTAGSVRDREMRRTFRVCDAREAIVSSELAERVVELRQRGRTPKEIARALGLRPADVTPVIRAIGAQAPKREAPVAGCWVTGRWSDRLGVTGHADWPGLPAAESESGESGLVGVLVARDTGSTVVACGFLVDVFCLGVKDTNGPKTMDRRKLPAFTRTFFSAWSGQPSVAAPLDLARHVVFGAVDYARSLGFEPHLEFAKGAALLGDWEAGSSDVTFGRDGKPMFINGPHDDTYAILAKLRKAVGEGNYDRLIMPGPRSIG
jgi:hypothetical protein